MLQPPMQVKFNKYNNQPYQHQKQHFQHQLFLARNFSSQRIPNPALTTHHVPNIPPRSTNIKILSPHQTTTAYFKTQIDTPSNLNYFDLIFSLILSSPPGSTRRIAVCCRPIPTFHHIFTSLSN